MDKKVTVKDVAREAGVSVATVSYIMNNRSDQKISDATRKKVLQIANLLNYRPSHAAVSLATGRTNVVGVAYALNPDTPSRNMEINSFVNLLIERMNRMKYDILFLSITNDDSSIITNRNIDAIIAIDLTYEQFKNLSERYLVPIINVDMIVNDNLFYQIYTDYPKLISNAVRQIGEDCHILIDKFANENLRSYIKQAYPTEQIIEIATVKDAFLDKRLNEKLVIIGTYLALLVIPYVQTDKLLVISSEETNLILPSHIHTIYNNVEKKANLTMNILLNALNHNFDLDHDCKVY